MRWPFRRRRTAPAALPEPAEKQGWIYFLLLQRKHGTDDPEWVKIGWSGQANPYRRPGEVTREYGRPPGRHKAPLCLGYIPGTERHEGYIHTMLEQWRWNGPNGATEWFRYSPQVEAAVAQFLTNDPRKVAA